MRNYEIMYIIKANLETGVTKEIVDNFNTILTQNSSTILEFKEIGLKDLAYEIQHAKKGYYVWLKVNANAETIAEFNRVVGITEDVIRYIVVKEGE